MLSTVSRENTEELLVSGSIARFWDVRPAAGADSAGQRAGVPDVRTGC
jgi:hypothetical protein